MTNFGFKQSEIDGSEILFKVAREIKLPDSYSYTKYLPKVLNQGAKPICVPCSVSCFINWKKNLEGNGNNIDHKVDLDAIYSSREDKYDDGMTFKEAFRFLRHEGVKTDFGIAKIGEYAKVGSELQLKQALIINGPCIGGLPVYDTYRTNFWEKYHGDSFIGGHAVAIVGYNKDGFIIRNSWGEKFGNNGYTTIPYDDFSKFYELWTVLN